jgi:hypothetical protein
MQRQPRLADAAGSDEGGQPARGQGGLHRLELVPPPDEAGQLGAVAPEFDERPRQALGWLTPSERLAEVVADTP